MSNKVISNIDNPVEFTREIIKMYDEMSAADDTLEDQEERLVDCE